MSSFAQNLTRQLLLKAAGSVLALGAFTCAATAGVDVSISGNGFSTTAIKVISENGKSWTKIRDGIIVLPVTIGLGMTDHTIFQYMVRQAGQPEGEYIGFSEYTADNTPIRLDFSAPYKGSTDHLSAKKRQEIIAACNANVGKGKGIRETHKMFTGVDVELRGNFIRESRKRLFEFEKAYAEWHSGSGNVTVPVECEAKAADDLAAATPDFKVKDIHLRFMTSAGYPTRPNPGAKCQLTHARVRVETSKVGPVKFKLWTKVGSEPMQSQFVEAMSAFAGPGKFEAVLTKPIAVSKTTNVQAMAEDLTNPIGQSTGWKMVKLNCTGAGGGGLAGTPGTANPDQIPDAPRQPPKRLIGGEVGDLTDRPRPTHRAPLMPPRFGQIKTAPVSMTNSVAARDRFYPSKPHVN